MPSVQMNTRLDESLKQRGDMVFAQLGYTPTDVVRMMWQFAANNAGDPAKVKRQLERMTGEEARTRRMEEQLRAINRPEELFRELAVQYGIDPDAPRQLPPELRTTSNAALRELAFDEERLAKYGVL